jgi:hypothetical protein
MSKIKTDDGTEIGSACSRTHAARHDKIDPRGRGFCRCEFGVVHSGRERAYQDDRLELATQRIECQKPMSIGEDPGPPIDRPLTSAVSPFPLIGVMSCVVAGCCRGRKHTGSGCSA